MNYYDMSYYDMKDFIDGTIRFFENRGPEGDEIIQSLKEIDISLYQYGNKKMIAADVAYHLGDIKWLGSQLASHVLMHVGAFTKWQGSCDVDGWYQQIMNHIPGGPNTRLMVKGVSSWEKNFEKRFALFPKAYSAILTIPEIYRYGPKWHSSTKFCEAINAFALDDDRRYYFVDKTDCALALLEYGG